MFGQKVNSLSVYTPEQVAEILQLSKNTVYELINNGGVVAKKIGRMYRIPARSIYFALTGLGFDLYQVESIDWCGLSKVQEEIEKVRTGL